MFNSTYKTNSPKHIHQQTLTKGFKTLALLLALTISASIMGPQAAYADVRDVNRTAGETVDTVLAPLPKPAPKTETKPDTKPLTCGVIFTILICW